MAGFASTRTAERTIAIGPRVGERFVATTPTHTTSAMQLASGVTANLVASFEAGGQYVCDLAVHGSEGVLQLPDPNAFGGAVRCQRERVWEDLPYVPFGGADARGIGLHDMVEGIRTGTPHRASAHLAAHVVEVAHGILLSAAEGRIVEIESRAGQPEPLPRDSLA